jgi:hypothetical protein
MKRNVIERNTTMDVYWRALNNENIYKMMSIMRSDNHEFYTTEVNNITPSEDDDTNIY